jgi:hypothetical protein
MQVASPTPRVPQEQDSAERAYNKLIRSFATQVELYQRRRASSEKVALQHVSVSVTRPPHQSVLKLADSRKAQTAVIGKPPRVPLRKGQKDDDQSSA